MKEIQKAMALAMVLALAIVVVFGAVGTSDSELSAEEPFSIPDDVTTINVTNNGSTNWDASNKQGPYTLETALAHVSNNEWIVIKENITLSNTLKINNSVRFTIASQPDSGGKCTIFGFKTDADKYKLFEITGANTDVTFRNIIIDGRLGDNTKPTQYTGSTQEIQVLLWNQAPR